MSKHYFTKDEIFQLVTSLKETEDLLSKKDTEILDYIQTVIDHCFEWEPDYEKLVYHRPHPVILHRNVMLLLHIFERKSGVMTGLREAWLMDNDEYDEWTYDLYTESAQELIRQLQGHWCIKFIEALTDECLKHLQKHSTDTKAYYATVLQKINNGQSIIYNEYEDNN